MEKSRNIDFHDKIFGYLTIIAVFHMRCRKIGKNHNFSTFFQTEPTVLVQVEPGVSRTAQAQTAQAQTGGQIQDVGRDSGKNF